MKRVVDEKGQKHGEKERKKKTARPQQGGTHSEDGEPATARERDQVLPMHEGGGKY